MGPRIRPLLSLPGEEGWSRNKNRGRKTGFLLSEIGDGRLIFHPLVQQTGQENRWGVPRELMRKASPEEGKMEASEKE